MESKKAAASEILGTMEELKASKREIHSQYALLGVLISTLDTRISTLETQLRDHSTKESVRVWDKFEDSGSCCLSPQVDDGASAPAFGSTTTLNLNVLGPDGRSEHITMTKNEKMKWIMSIWCLHWHEKLVDNVFLYKGQLLSSDWTPQELQMKDGDEIFVERRWI